MKKINLKTLLKLLPVVLITATPIVILSSQSNNYKTASLIMSNSEPKETTYSLKITLTADYPGTYGGRNWVRFATENSFNALDTRLVFTVKDGEIDFANCPDDSSVNRAMFFIDDGSKTWSGKYHANFNGCKMTAGSGDTCDIGDFYDTDGERNWIRMHYGKKLFGTPRLDFQICHRWSDSYSGNPFTTNENGFAFYANNTIHGYDGDVFDDASNHYEWI